MALGSVNAPPTNLVQVGIGGWTQPREWYSTARKRRTTLLTLDDVDHSGIEKVAEYALEVAWRDAACAFLSFAIDCVDPAFAPGEGRGSLPAL